MNLSKCNPLNVLRGFSFLVFSWMRRVPCLGKDLALAFYFVSLLTLPAMQLLETLGCLISGDSLSAFIRRMPAALQVWCIASDIGLAHWAARKIYAACQGMNREDVFDKGKDVALPVLVCGLIGGLACMMGYGLSLRDGLFTGWYHYAGHWNRLQIACLVVADVMMTFAVSAVGLGFAVGVALILKDSTQSLCRKGLALGRLSRWKQLRTASPQGSLG